MYSANISRPLIISPKKSFSVNKKLNDHQHGHPWLYRVTTHDNTPWPYQPVEDFFIFF
jgi:hypothetical protein